MAEENAPTTNLDELKNKLYKAFDQASELSTWPSIEEKRESARAMAKVAEVILKIEQEQREAGESKPSLKL